jgi:hypothetical protein
VFKSVSTFSVKLSFASIAPQTTVAAGTVPPEPETLSSITTPVTWLLKLPVTCPTSCDPFGPEASTEKPLNCVMPPVAVSS